MVIYLFCNTLITITTIPYFSVPTPLPSKLNNIVLQLPLLLLKKGNDFVIKYN